MKNIFDMSVTHDKLRQSYCKQLKAGRVCVYVCECCRAIFSDTNPSIYN